MSTIKSSLDLIAKHPLAIMLAATAGALVAFVKSAQATWHAFAHHDFSLGAKITVTTSVVVIALAFVRAWGQRKVADRCARRR